MLTNNDPATSGKNCSLEKTACGAPSKPQHTTIKECKNALMMLQCKSKSYAPAASFSSTMRISSTKLAGNLTHTPINNPIKAICEIRIFFLCMHSILVIAIAVAIITAIAVAVNVVITVGITFAAPIAVAISIAITIAAAKAVAVAVAVNIAVPIAIPFAIAVTIALSLAVAFAIAIAIAVTMLVSWHCWTSLPCFLTQ
jgi:hypothetical protein